MRCFLKKKKFFWGLAGKKIFLTPNLFCLLSKIGTNGKSKACDAIKGGFPPARGGIENPTSRASQSARKGISFPAAIKGNQGFDILAKAGGGNGLAGFSRGGGIIIGFGRDLKKMTCLVEVKDSRKRHLAEKRKKNKNEIGVDGEGGRISLVLI